MQTDLKLHRVSPEQILLGYVERRLNFALSRFGDRVGRVIARITTTAPGKQEFICHITADLRPFGITTAEAIDADVFAAIDRCTARLARRCESKWGRMRTARSSRSSIRTQRYLPAA